jgi:recombination protein RecT
MAVQQQQVATRENSVALVLKSLEQPEWQDQITKSLPPNVTMDRFMATAVSAVRNFRDIDRCEKASVYNSVVQAARAGLLLDGRQAALVKFTIRTGENQYADVARYMPMVEGIIHQLGNAGITCYAVSVYANDKIELWNDEFGQHVRHSPVAFGDRGARVGALAAAKTEDGATYVEVLDMADIQKIMKVSRSRNKKGELVGPWVDWPDRMEQKSVLHRLAKRIPKPDNFRMPEDPDLDVPSEPIESTPAEVEPPQQQAAAPKQQKRRPSSLQAVVEGEVQTRDEPPREEFDNEVPFGDSPI